ncbi:MAG: DUF4339 domain-containing protein [Deltaproteobacteria bacterium]|nr:DUF4339 domain-containing protein [Deltaproteobacteria bacterium]
MENTGQFLFDNTSAKYYLYLRGTTVGPLTAEEIYERIERREVTLLDSVWRMGWTDFKRICDEKEFAVLVPPKPAAYDLKNLQARIQEQLKPKTRKILAVPAPQEPSHYLYFKKTQYGPFSRAELIHVLESNKIDASAFLWTPGWSNWRSLPQVTEFAVYLGQPAAPAPADSWPAQKRKPEGGSKSMRKDKRDFPRRPLVARLFVANEADVIIAVCRDISVGGMQVLTDRVPGPVGAKVKLNVSPADAKKVKGFVAEGEIVRTLEDGRGFSFRFTRISSDAKKAIEKYISV